jgi:L-Ala-D/L-Glu epimerase
MALSLDTFLERWPIAGSFTIARGAKREAIVIVAQIGDGGGICGRGECVPYARYGETIDSVRETIKGYSAPLNRACLLQHMPAGAARNAIDCALWDHEAKCAGIPAATLAGLPPPRPLTTAYTISLDKPETMALKASAAAARGLPLLKLKLGGAGDRERMRLVRSACPTARLIGDANEAWTPRMLPELLAVASETGMELIEQPLPAAADGALASVAHPVPICADESLHTREGLADLAGRYEAVNIKLDKAGGLTAALDLSIHARAMGFKIMVGCMVATSLSMAPALLVAQTADWVDLDGPLLLAKDRAERLRYDGATVYPPDTRLWG